MKTCPFCAEQIPEDAGRCPYCDSDLSATPGAGSAQSAASQPSSAPQPSSAWQPEPAGQDAPPRVVGQGAVGFSHSGATYILGWGTTFFGIWDRHAPGDPVRTFPRTDEGWRDAWLAYTSMESNFVAVTPSGSPGSSPGR